MIFWFSLLAACEFFAPSCPVQVLLGLRDAFAIGGFLRDATEQGIARVCVLNRLYAPDGLIFEVCCFERLQRSHILLSYRIFSHRAD